MLGRIHPTTLRVIVLFFVLVLVALFFSTQIDRYLTPRLFTRISTSVAIIAILAVGQAIVVLTRNIDLSLGSIVGCVAYFIGSLVSAFPDIPAVLVPVIAMAMGAVFGAINGLLVSRLNLPSIIVTLATLAIFRSLVVEASDGRSITATAMPDWITNFARANALVIGDFQIRWIVVVALVVVLCVHVFLTRFRAGRRFYAAGSNPDAATYAGINVKQTVLLAFLLSGALAGLAAFIFLARFGNITVVAGLGFELKSVGAVVVGGVNIFGGSGSVIGVLLGAVMIDLIDSSLVRWELVSEFWRDAVLGLLILFAVALDAFLTRSLARRKKSAAKEEAAEERVIDPPPAGSPASAKSGGGAHG
ncbi:MAG: ABC transporter permease [Silicimonas sp.]|nr:ABC transporter permease [Silicimonas sp.]